MTTTFAAAMHAVVAPLRSAPPACPPDCRYEYMCDSENAYYRRECCYRPDCVYYCGSWIRIGAC